MHTPPDDSIVPQKTLNIVMHPKMLNFQPIQKSEGAPIPTDCWVNLWQWFQKIYKIHIVFLIFWLKFQIDILMTGHIVILVLCNKVIPKKQPLWNVLGWNVLWHVSCFQPLGLAKFIIRTLSGAFARVTGVNSPLSARKASFLKVTICSHKFPSNSKLFL